MRRNENKVNANKLAKYVARAQRGDRKAMERIVDETSVSQIAEGERGYTIEMSVDKETGSLLAFKAEGGINVELITTEFTVDSTLDLSIFDDLSKL